jgi:hypothetical protein
MLKFHPKKTNMEVLWENHHVNFPEAYPIPSENITESILTFCKWHIDEFFRDFWRVKFI